MSPGQTSADLPALMLVTAIYLLAVGYLGYLGYRSTRSSTDYLLAGRDVPPPVMALSYGATFISTAAIVGFGGVAAQLGMGRRLPRLRRARQAHPPNEPEPGSAHLP